MYNNNYNNIDINVKPNAHKTIALIQSVQSRHLILNKF